MAQYPYLSKDELEYVLLRIHKEIEKYAKAENTTYDDSSTSYGETTVQKVLEKIEELLGDKLEESDLTAALADYMANAGGTFTGPVTFDAAATATFNGAVTVPDAADTSKDGTAANTKFVAAAIEAALKDVTGISFDGPYDSYEDMVAKVTSPKTGVIYLVKNTKGSTPNVSDEYFWNKDTSTFELFGSTAVDLTGYVKAEEMIKFTQTDIDDAFTQAGYDAYTPPTGV